MAHLIMHSVGPQVTVQDLGRPGHLSVGLSRGGAADRRALAEGASLLGQSCALPALELAGAGGVFELSEPRLVALTGAPMRAAIDGKPVGWNRSHLLLPGERLTLGSAETGVYGYLSVSGGVRDTEFLGSHSAHLIAGIGRVLRAGDTCLLGKSATVREGMMTLDVEDRFQGGTVRVVPGAQTSFFNCETRRRFATTRFTRGTRGNRQGVALDFDGAPLEAEGQRTILSELILPGDIQMTGEGRPFVLLPECQTIGGYPRIGTVLPEDLPRVAQAAPGAVLEFSFLGLEEARALHRPEDERFAAIRASVAPAYRDPRQMRDLLMYQLVSGATAGDEDEADQA